MPELSRRVFLRASVGSALSAGALPLLLSACGGPLPLAVGSVATPAPSVSGGRQPTGAGTSSAGVLPTYVPLQGGAKPDFPSTGPEYEDGFSVYPANPIKAWLKDPPGTGSTVNAFTMKLSALPSTPLDQNPAWQEVHRQLNAQIVFNSPLAIDYPTRLGAIMAGNDLPDIILFNGGLNIGLPGVTGVPNLPAFLERSMADLTPYLGGDAARDYPFLAAIPTFAWRNSGCAYNGKLYMWPLERYLPGVAFIKNVDLWDREIGPNYVPRNADDFKRILLQFTRPAEGRYAIGGSAGVISGGAVGIMSLLRLFPSVFGAPNNWRADSSGNLVKDFETPEYKESIAYLSDLVAAGIFFPDTLTNPTGPTTGSFPSGKAAMTVLSFGVTWTAMWTAMQAIKPVVNFLPLAPFAAHDGAQPVHHLGPGYLVTLGLKKATPDRIKELLRIVDWLTAPFGSAEDFLLTYGLPEIDHTLNADGRPVTTPRTNADVDAVGWKYISQRPQVMTWPAWPDFARIAHDFEHAVIPVGISDPTLGFVSQTNFARGVTLAQAVTDGVTDIILGRRSINEYDQLVKDWQTNGGNQIRAELRQAMSVAH
jgi:putative aldouronate transport system substrate-binding protein